MAGRVIPEDFLALSPALRNLTENPSAVQFNHRTAVYNLLDCDNLKYEVVYCYLLREILLFSYSQRYGFYHAVLRYQLELAMR